MNSKERRKHRRKQKSLGVKNAYARLGGIITEIEILDKAPQKNARVPVTVDENGKIVGGPAPEIHPRNPAEEVIWQFMKR